MLYEYLANGFISEGDWNCAERMLLACNQVYGLGLDAKAIKLAAGFGGGMGCGYVCGALTGALQALGVLFVEERAHESDCIKRLSKELFSRYAEQMGNIDCTPLKAQYRTEEWKCRDVILAAAKIIDEIVAREQSARQQIQ